MDTDAKGPTIVVPPLESERELNPLYEPLTKAGEAVRFLKILPPRTDTEQDKIHCALLEGSLDDGYHAVSYVWGSKTDPIEILINGHPVRVTKNLHNLLTAFRSNLKMLQNLLWIDAVCINQEDFDERNEQVRIMGDIYARAAVVHIWMDWPTPRTKALGERLGKIPHFLGNGKSMSDIVDDDELWPEFRRLVDHEWFTRVWVIQEAVKAKARVVWCGNILMDFDDISNAGFALGDAIYHGLTGIQRKVDTSYIWLLNGKLIRFKPNHRCYSATDIKGILDVFFLAQSSKCTDAKDRIYGLLSLIPRSVGLTVDYRMSMVEVWATAVFELMSWSGSLEPLRLCQPDRRSPGLPSWVPDFDGRLAPYKNFEAAGELDGYKACGNTAFSGTYVRPSELHVRAFEVDTIQVCHPFALPVQDAEPRPGHPDHNEEQYMRKVIKRWRSMVVKFVTWNNERDEETMEAAFWQAMVVEKLPDVQPQSADTAAKFFKYVDGELATNLYKWLNATEKDPHYNMNKYLLSIVSTSLKRQMFFVTTGGRMGSIYQECKVGDIVAVLAGLSRPVVLRARQGENDAKRQVVATAYCDGLMNREEIANRTGDAEGLEQLVREMVLV